MGGGLGGGAEVILVMRRKFYYIIFILLPLSAELIISVVCDKGWQKQKLKII